MNEAQERHDHDPLETEEWVSSLCQVLQSRGAPRVQFLLEKLLQHAYHLGIPVPGAINTPYLNSIPTEEQPPYPGNQQMERRIRSIVRWNAMAMVVRANKIHSGLGGHISTYASAATLLEVAFNHFFKGKGNSGDQVFFQGHSAPGIYARSFLEGRLSIEQMENFRRELEKNGGLSSYPHPWLMPDYWEFPTVSMGLGPISAIYQARFNRYLKARGILDTDPSRVWCFLGDGETDEPEALGALTVASREKLDNLIFVVNCNLQRLDGPVRGNGKIIQELEAHFRGAGWNVIKVIWGSDWDELLKNDATGHLRRRMEEALDGHFQKYSVETGDYTRKNFFGTYPDLLKLVENLNDMEIRKLRRGGHDPEKVYAAYHAAVRHRGQPTAILAKTIKGYGLGEAGEGKNITHQQKKLNEEELVIFRDRFEIPIPDSKIHEIPFYHPGPKSPEVEYLLERRRQLGGFLPHRHYQKKRLSIPPLSRFAELLQGTNGRAVSTTMAFGRLLNLLLRDHNLGKRIVPIIPDEARTFGLDPLFRQVGIYSPSGSLYEPVDRNSLLYYRESKDGQVLEEGITEAGSVASLTAAATAYATHSEPMIPFYIFYSMFGFQRTGDQLWALGDIRGRGFVLGATYGRTTLMGEGLQHQDGHSHILTSVIPNVRCYHPAFAYEIAVIIRDGLKRMYEDQEDIFYYLSLQNENYPMPTMPQGTEEGILKGIYPYKRSEKREPRHVHLFGDSALINETLRAQQILKERFAISSDVWSVTSYPELRRNALETERWNLLHPTDPPQVSFLAQVLGKECGPFIATSDAIRALPDQIARWMPMNYFTLGTDGFGRSDTREALRNFFEVSAEHIVFASLSALTAQDEFDRKKLPHAMMELGISKDKPNPMSV